MTARPRIVILGGGFAGMEAAFSLHQHLGDRVDLAMVSDQDTFLFKPNTIYLPFGAKEAKLHIGLVKPLARRHVAFHNASVAEVDFDANRVDLSDGTRLPYDYLVVATGAAMRPDEVPGLAEHAQTIWTPQEMYRLREKLGALRVDAEQGKTRRVLFLVPPNNKCSGPLYELVFMVDTWLRRVKVRDSVRLTWTTYEDSYIQAFGPRLHDVVSAEFASREIDGQTGAVVAKVLPDEVQYTDGTTRAYDLLVAFPPYVGGRAYPGLPTDDRGFITTDLATRQVVGHPRVYAPGDAGDFPVKQAFLALLQADAVADDIATMVEPSAVRRFRPFEPTSMCVMEMFDKATFAQVPLELTGDPAHPVRVVAGAEDRYRVGVSPLWRLGKKTLGIYLPMQFGAGRPFHGGRAWQAMEIGLKGMSRALASGAERVEQPAAK